MKTLTHNELALQIFGRRKPGSFSVNITRKQVEFLVNLWNRDTRQSRNPGHTIPIYCEEMPLDVVIYPNGAGFIRAAMHACEPVPHPGKGWRWKPGYGDGK